MTRKGLRYPVLLVLGLALLVAGCSDDDDNSVQPVSGQIVHEGSGPIDDRGGRVEITDPESPLSGAFIEIPEGALNTSVEISISAVTGDVVVPGDPASTIVKFEPVGQSFSKQIRLGLPYNHDYNSGFRIFNFDSEMMTFEEVIIDQQKPNDYLLECSVSELGSYVATGPYGVRMNSFDRYGTMRQINNKIGFRCQIQNVQSGENPNFKTIENLPVVEDEGFENVREVIENSVDPVISHFKATLLEAGDSLQTPLEELTLSIERVSANNGNFAVAIHLNQDPEEFFVSYPLSSDSLMYWMSGKGLMFRFDYDYDENLEYYVDLEWALSNDFQLGYDNRYTTLFHFINYDEAKKYSSMKSDAYDSNGHRNDLDYIDNRYQPNKEDEVPPVVSGIPPSQPLEGENALLQASATDSVGVTLVKFERLVDSDFVTVGETSIGNENNRYQVAWNTLEVPNGNYEIRAIAFDAAQNSDTTNNTWTVTVANPHIPVLTIETPAGKQDSAVVINFDVVDEDGDDNKFFFYFSTPDSAAKPMTIFEASAGELEGHVIDNLEPGQHSITWDSDSDFPDLESTDITITVNWYNRNRHEEFLTQSDPFWVDNYDEPLIPVLVDYEIDPEEPIIYPGGSFIVRYQVQNPNAFRVGIGLDAIARDSNGNEIELEPSGFTYQLSRNEDSWIERVAMIPNDFDEGVYGFSFIMRDAEDEIITATDFTEHSFEVLEANYITQDFELGTSGQMITMVWIPPGDFMMGSDAMDADAENRELPSHQVTFANANGFWMSAYEVTQDQWQAIMHSNPSNFEGGNLPVEHVSWNDITNDYLPRINAIELGSPWRLPSEAEWEYAARAGVDESRFPWGDDPDYTMLEDYAWIGSNSNNQTHYVGTRRANDWGLYDMIGNVYEWVEDWYHIDYNGAPSDGSPWLEPEGNIRFGRGGCWQSTTIESRPAYRGMINLPSSRSVIYGFRLVRDAD